MNRTLLDESLRVKGRTECRTEWYFSPAEIQRDLDAYSRSNNLRRHPPGISPAGPQPAQTLRETLAIEKLPPFAITEPIDSEPSAT